MKKTLDKYDFIREFMVAGRANEFSILGLNAIFNFLTAKERESGDELIFILEGICRAFTEYKRFDLAADDLGYDSIKDIEKDMIVLYLDNAGVIVIKNYV